ncbi:efflux RND transporter permease subunit, partial [Paenibacillus sepulcri]|nr:efflux RND transporter permease subunit [Paenibacillus sepulcri]
DKSKAAQRGITLSAIQSALQSLDYALPLGTIQQEETAIPIRLNGKVSSLDQIKSLRLVTGAGGAAPGVTLLSDIAEIKTVSTHAEITRFNGEPSFVLEVVKNQDANTADVSDEVKEVLGTYQDKGELNVHVIQDQGEDIKESVSGLINEGLFGTLFCVIIIFLFLRNVRATIISILSLPISIFATIAIMNQMGYTLNIMTLGGIAISVGRIVDDSIVVIENIFRWRQEKGEQLKGKELAYQATREVISAVSSSTVAMVVVFAPLAFVSGIIGEFFRPFSLAVVISILTSLLVAMMLIPILGAAFFKNIKPHKQGGKLADSFEKIIRSSLKRKGIVISLSVLLLVGSLSLIPLLGVAFLPAGSTPTASIELTLPTKSSLARTDQVSGKVEDYVKNMDGVERYDTSIGSSSGNPLQSSGARNKATITAQFVKETDMDMIVDRINAELPAIVAAEEAGSTINVKAGEQQGPPTGNTIDVSVYADDPDLLAKSALQIGDLMKQNSDLKDVTNNMNEVTPKWVLTLNRQGIDANVNPLMVMQLASEQLRPLDAGMYTIDNEAREIMLSYRQQITSREELENIPIMTSSGMKNLKDVADITEQNAWVKVNHDDGKMAAQISGTVKNPDNVSSVTNQVETAIHSMSFPAGVEVSI